MTLHRAACGYPRLPVDGLPKFRDLFASEELYFRRTDLFKETDPDEALPSDEWLALKDTIFTTNSR